MKVVCRDCAHFSLKKAPLRAHSFGLCKIFSAGSEAKSFSPTYPRECAKFKQAEPDVIAARTRALN